MDNSRHMEVVGRGKNVYIETVSYDVDGNPSVHASVNIDADSIEELRHALLVHLEILQEKRKTWLNS